MVLGLLGRKSPRPSPRASRSSSPSAPGQDQYLTLIISVIEAKNLAPADKSGTSDPYAVVVLDDFKATTQAIPKTLNPEWNAIFKVNLYPVRSDFIIEGTVWDKDRFSKDYLGNFYVSLIEKFSQDGAIVTYTEENKPQWYPLHSTKARKNNIRGSVCLKLSLSDPLDPGASNGSILAKWKAITNHGHFDTPIDAIAVDDNAADSNDSYDEQTDAELSSEESAQTAPTAAGENKSDRRRRLGRLMRRATLKPYQFSSLGDVVGTVFFEIIKVTDLPPERNVTRTGFDMDPFVVVSFGKNVVRTGVQRHNLNPVFNEKVLFQVLRHEQQYTFNINVVDRDSLSGNDMVASASLPLQEILKYAPKANPTTGIYDLPLVSDDPNKTITARGRHISVSTPRNGRSASRSPVPKLDDASELISAASRETGASADSSLHLFTIPLLLKNKARWEEKHNPEIQISAKYVPYSALRQQFWRYMFIKHDADGSGMLSRYEFADLLEYLGSTLHSDTIDGFFTRFGKSLDQDLTFDEAIICLEDQLLKDGKSATVDHGIALVVPSSENVVLPPVDAEVPAGPASAVREGDHLIAENNGPFTDTVLQVDYDELEQELRELSASENKTSAAGDSRTASTENLSGVSTPSPPMNSYDEEIEEKADERVITVRECPVCHQPRLDKRAELDIVTHLATCASQDWKQVDLLTMSSYVTSDQAKRKWLGKVVSKISYGGYKLGANSANILVQDRITGYVFEERMSMYVRLGIRLLYKGLKSREMERTRIRKILASLSIKQGKKYDDPRSVQSILPFIEFHRLDLSDVLRPLDDFKSFNDFFYRELKPDARHCAAPDNPKIITSPADCRTVVFDSIDSATAIWIKGKDFCLERLFGAAYPAEVQKYVGGSMGIFRLAPQDYHRFHIPVDGVLGEPRLIEGAYYTVNPMAIRSDLDVYGENVRVLVPIDSDQFGRVMVVCVGAMMVGSTVITAKPGQRVSRAQELGYFKFGGSTILLFFQRGKMAFDSDLLSNSRQSLETLIRVGMSIGHAQDEPEWEHAYGNTDHMTLKDKAEAARRVEGSLAPVVIDL